MSRRRRRRRGIPGVSFSWRRALGISGAKARLSRQLGVPLTRSGRQRKVGRMLGCALPAGLLLLGLAAAALLQLAPLNLRAARREQERIRALDYAESGVAYAIAWPQANDFDHTSWTDGTHVSLPDESGGFRDVTISFGPVGK